MQMISDIKETFRSFRDGTLSILFCSLTHPNTNTLLPKPLTHKIPNPKECDESAWPQIR